jgi:hypothetical protein
LESNFSENFADVPGDKYYSEAIGIAKELGVISGVGNNSFEPMNEISRQDMFVILARALQKQGKLTISADLTALNSFADASEVADYAKESVNALISNGYVKGAGNNRINPTSQATRAEAAVLLYSFVQE